MAKELQWKMNGDIERKFTKEWDSSGVINKDKIPDLITGLVESRNSMIDYIETLHNKIDDLIRSNNICSVEGCHTAGCTSDHK